MPIYEYSCKDCGNHFELVRPMKEADAANSCKKCQSERTVRMISLFSAKTREGVIAGAGGGCSCGGGGCGGGNCGSCRN